MIGRDSASRKRGYSLIAVNSDDDGERQKELLSLLRSQRVEGILLVIAAAPTPLNQISRILDAGIPVVCLDRIPDRVAVDSVSVDDLEAAEMGIRHLMLLRNPCPNGSAPPAIFSVSLEVFAVQR